jgi:hypothetical protein
VERIVLEEDEKLFLQNPIPHKMFSISPFGLRREDLLHFINAPETEKQMVFWDYLRSTPTVEWSDSLSETVVQLRRERLEIKKLRRALLANIARKLGITPEEISPAMYFGGGVKELLEGIPLKQHELKDDFSKLKELSKTISAITATISAHTSTSHQPPRGEVETILLRVGEILTKSFCALSPSTFVKRIELICGKLSPMSLELRVTTNNGKSCRRNKYLAKLT